MIALGASLGANARYLVGMLVAAQMGTEFPWGTLIINVTGSLVIGFFLTLISEQLTVNPLWRLFFATGFLGGYTTFSTFSFECIDLLREGAVLEAAAYVAASVVGGIAAAFIGIVAGRWVLTMEIG